MKADESVDPHFAKALRMGYGFGLKVFAFNCEVNGKEITLNEESPSSFSTKRFNLIFKSMISSIPI